MNYTHIRVNVSKVSDNAENCKIYKVKIIIMIKAIRLLYNFVFCNVGFTDDFTDDFIILMVW